VNKLPKIYIIGNTDDYRSLTTKIKINKLEKRLTNKGFEVINPLEVYEKNILITSTEAIVHNIKKLISCKAVYIMPEVSLKKGENLELKISLDINLIVLQGLPVHLDQIDEIK
jgi:alpha-N-acetylglucosamine transferase